MSAQHIHFFFTMREQIKLYHWQTYSYARHKATDDVLDSLDKQIDEFVEVYMGKYGRPHVSAKTSNIHIQNMSEKSAVGFIRKCIASLLGPVVSKLDPDRDSDLINIRDEMLASLNQLLYLFTLR
jgi:DNA-binding ferritin-like protein